MEQNIQKQRHGCLTAYLIFMIISCAFTGIANILLGVAGGGEAFATLALPLMTNSLIIILGFIAFVNTIFAIAILKWKKWGFWGFVMSAIITFCINIYAGIGVFSSLFGFFGILVLFGVLHIGGEKKGWIQLD